MVHSGAGMMGCDAGHGGQGTEVPTCVGSRASGESAFFGDVSFKEVVGTVMIPIS